MPYGQIIRDRKQFPFTKDSNASISGSLAVMDQQLLDQYFFFFALSKFCSAPYETHGAAQWGGSLSLRYPLEL